MDGSRRDPTFLASRAAQYAGSLGASLANPLNPGRHGRVTGGLADAVLPATAPLLAKLAAHYLGTWTDFAAIDKLQE